MSIENSKAESNLLKAGGPRSIGNATRTHLGEALDQFRLQGIVQCFPSKCTETVLNQPSESRVYKIQSTNTSSRTKCNTGGSEHVPEQSERLRFGRHCHVQPRGVAQSHYQEVSHSPQGPSDSPHVLYLTKSFHFVDEIAHLRLGFLH